MYEKEIALAYCSRADSFVPNYSLFLLEMLYGQGNLGDIQAGRNCSVSQLLPGFENFRGQGSAYDEDQADSQPKHGRD